MNIDNLFTARMHKTNNKIFLRIDVDVSSVFLLDNKNAKINWHMSVLLYIGRFYQVLILLTSSQST